MPAQSIRSAHPSAGASSQWICSKDEVRIMTNTEHLDLGALAELQEVMEEEFSLLLQTFLKDSVIRIHQIRESLEAGQAEEFGRACHSLKGSCSNVGVPLLASYCLRGERMGRAGDLSQAPEVMKSIEEEFAVVHQLLQEYL